MGGKAFEGEAVNAMAEGEQMASTYPQLVREMLRRHAVREAAQDHHHPRAGVVRALQGGRRKEIENATARAAPVVGNRCATAVMRGLVGRQRVSVGASQPVRVQDLEQERVAPVAVEQIINWERHHRVPRGTVLARRGKARFTKNGS